MKHQFEVKPRPGLLVAEGFISMNEFTGTERELEDTQEELEEDHQHHELDDEEAYDEAMV